MVLNSSEKTFTPKAEAFIQNGIIEWITLTIHCFGTNDFVIDDMLTNIIIVLPVDRH